MTDELDEAETLDSIFDDTPEPQGDTEPEHNATAKEPQEEEGDEGARAEAEPEGEEEAAEPPAANEQKSVPVAALQDERRKRQQLEDELKKYRQQQPVKDENAPDPAEDPEAYRDYIRKQVREEERRERIETSRVAMLEKHEDYEKMEKTFLFLANQDPALVEAMNKHPDPARFAYDTAVEHFAQQETALEARIREKLMKELGIKPETEQPSKAEQRKQTAVKMPNLTDAASKGSNSAPVEKEIELDDMFSDQKY